MKNPETLFLIKNLANSIKKNMESASSAIKDQADIEALMMAKTVPQENAQYYRNLRDIYKKIDFGNNVKLPFYIDNNVATCLKIITPKNPKPKLKAQRDLKELLGLKQSSSIQDIQEKIKEMYDFEMKVVEATSVKYNSGKSDNIPSALSSIEGSVWEASLKKFMGEFEEIGGDPEQLALDANAVKKAKKIRSILSMMENKQKAILEKNGVEENPFIKESMTTRKQFDSESEGEFLSHLKSNYPEAYMDFIKESKIDPSIKFMGVFHLDEIIDISPELRSILDIELSNKTNYKVKISKEEKEKPQEDEQIILSGASNSSIFSDDLEEQGIVDDIDDVEVERMLNSF